MPFAENGRDSFKFTFDQPIQDHQGNYGWQYFTMDGHEEYQGHAAPGKDLIVYFLTF
jgi:hypothetical protein